MSHSATERRPKQAAGIEPRPKRIRLTAEARRTQLIDVAITLFGEHGFAGTTTKAIARAAGVSEAIIFRHFPSKVELYKAAFERWRGADVTRFVAYLKEYADRGDDYGLLRTLYAALLYGYEQERSLHRMVLYAGLEAGTEGNGRLTDSLANPLTDFLAQYITQRQQEGVFRLGDVRLIVGAMFALPQSYAMWTKLAGAPSEHSDEEVADLLAHLLFDGIRA